MPTYRYRCIGKGTTDAQGIAHITHDCEGNQLATTGYTGVGAGMMDFVASTTAPTSMSESSFQSSVHEVIDALYYDRCNTDTTSNYTIGTGASLTTDTGSLKYSVGSATSGNRYVRLDRQSSAVNDYKGKSIRLKVDVNPSNEVRLGVRQQISGVWGDATYSNYANTASTITYDVDIDPNATRIYFSLDCQSGANGDTVNFSNFTLYSI